MENNNDRSSTPAFVPPLNGRPPPQDADVPAPRLARAILFAVLGGFLLVTGLDMMSAQLDLTERLVADVAFVVIAVLQVLHTLPAASRASIRRRSLTLGLQAVVTFLPLIAFKAEWGAMAGLFAGSALLLLPARLGWSLFGLTGMVMLVDPIVGGRSIYDTVYLCESTLLAGLCIFGISRLSTLVESLQASRGELARLAITNERLRFARDLHDLLGYSLSAITLKSELLMRLLVADPERAAEEVASILSISRQSLADVRTVAAGYRDMSLSQEAASAASMLAAAGIEVLADISTGPLGQEVDTVLATVLREGVANALRHSRVRTCRINASAERGRVRLSLLNDGVNPVPQAPAANSGSGLGNLALRLQSVGGVLSAEPVEDGLRFLLLAEVPVATGPDQVGGLDQVGGPDQVGATIPSPDSRSIPAPRT